ncbi:hypothetical protein Efla_001152 [Eimeria flavescens]
MKLNHLVAAKDKIIQSLSGRRLGELSPSRQHAAEATQLTARQGEAPHSPAEAAAVQVVGGVDLGVLYNRYKESVDGGASSAADAETVCPSQGTAEPSPVNSDSESEGPAPPPSPEKVFRTEAAARLAAAPHKKNAAPPLRSRAAVPTPPAAAAAAAALGVRVTGLWPKPTLPQQQQLQQQQQQLQQLQQQKQHKQQQQQQGAVEQQVTPKPDDGRACRIAPRYSAEAAKASLKSPRQMLSEIAREGTYTHIIPVSKSGSPKGMVRARGPAAAASAAAAAAAEEPAARVVEACDYRFFVFNIPEAELIRSRDFQLISCISQGSFGTVYRAKWKGLTVAVKQAHGKMTLEAMRSVAREVNAYRMVEHPLIVKYYGVCLEHNFVALVTEYLTGGNIFDILFENKVTLSAAIRLKMCRQLIDAVHFLHEEKRLVHRDLKTANLVVDSQYNIRLCDFGKTRPLEQHGKLRLEDNGGSPRYMAPECFVEGNLVDEKVDIWGLACCLIEILGGPIPFEDIHSNEGKRKHTEIHRQMEEINKQE